jgi:hypothetical protein
MSEIKVNKISPRSGTDVTLGDSGDTFTIPSGATINNQGTATNFGATGSASWVTTVKTGDFTAVAGEGYFVNTTSGEIDVALPAGTPGAVVAIKDYAGTFDTNRVLLVQNGSDKIGGSTINVQLSEEGIAVTLVFVDSTQGWLVTDSGLQSEAPSPSFIAATGGTITTSGNFKIHTFTGPGTFTVCSVGNAAGSNTVDYLVVAGGASGGNGGGSGGGSGTASGGGGAGGYRESSGTASGSYTTSPLGCGVSALPVTATGFPITVGGGGASNGPSPSAGQQGNPGAVSTFSSITSAGGGTGGGWTPSPGSSGLPGGSGGGASQTGSIGSGNTPPVTPPQGNDGGPPSTPNGSGGGGGGATAAGAQGTAASPGPANAVGGVGGAGATSSITASPVARAGGGGGGAGGDLPGGPAGAPGPASSGGGAGGATGVAGTVGTINTGGGGGGGGANPGKVGGAGGSGIVVIRYKFQ